MPFLLKSARATSLSHRSAVSVAERTHPRSFTNIAACSPSTATELICGHPGLLGTLGGGLLLDICTRVFGLETIEASLLLTVVLMIAAWPICFVAFTTTNFSIFVSCMFVGQLFAFATTSPVNGVLLWCVPSTTRTLSMALSVLAMHLLGDVPSPVVVGAMFEAMPDHPSRVMQIVASLMGVAVLFWTLAWLLARRQNARRRAAEQENDVEGTGVPLLSAR